MIEEYIKKEIKDIEKKLEMMNPNDGSFNELDKIDRENAIFFKGQISALFSALVKMKELK